MGTLCPLRENISCLDPPPLLNVFLATFFPAGLRAAQVLKFGECPHKVAKNPPSATRMPILHHPGLTTLSLDHSAKSNHLWAQL
ncbi:hypothetical protein J6590_070121 [Homalodisca vitripennis]|nr:hypothetical protein J6590_070121 [Homalodisca vitripennis]